MVALPTLEDKRLSSKQRITGINMSERFEIDLNRLRSHVIRNGRKDKYICVMPGGTKINPKNFASNRDYSGWRRSLNTANVAGRRSFESASKTAWNPYPDQPLHSRTSTQ